METPERIFFHHSESFFARCGKLMAQETDSVLSERKSDLDVEYVRKDLSEQLAKDFKCFSDESQKYSVEDEFTEFINSRKK